MTKIMLIDVPGGPEFIERCVAAIRDAALAFVGEPDDRVIAHLQSLRADFECELAEHVGSSAAVSFVDTFIAAVMGHKRDLEAKGGSRA